MVSTSLSLGFRSVLLPAGMDITEPERQAPGTHPRPAKPCLQFSRTQVSFVDITIWGVSRDFTSTIYWSQLWTLKSPGELLKSWRLCSRPITSASREWKSYVFLKASNKQENTHQVSTAKLNLFSKLQSIRISWRTYNADNWAHPQSLWVCVKPG